MENSQFNSNKHFNPYQSEMGSGRRQYNPQQKINTYLAWNIVATVVGALLFNFSCCIAFIVGIVGIIFSVLAKNCLDIGDYYQAKSHSTVALILMICSFSFSFFILFSLLLIGVSFFALLFPFAMF